MIFSGLYKKRPNSTAERKQLPIDFESFFKDVALSSKSAWPTEFRASNQITLVPTNIRELSMDVVTGSNQLMIGPSGMLQRIRIGQ